MTIHELIVYLTQFEAERGPNIEVWLSEDAEGNGMTEISELTVEVDVDGLPSPVVVIWPV